MKIMEAHEVIDKVGNRQHCCGATNPHCEAGRPFILITGCEDCGHSLSCHNLPNDVLVRYREEWRP